MTFNRTMAAINRSRGVPDAEAHQLFTYLQ
jgi:hypothetical protein